MKGLVPRVWGTTMVAALLAWATSASAQSESAGVGQYFNNCASCHESDEHEIEGDAELDRE